LVTGVQTCALPIYGAPGIELLPPVGVLLGRMPADGRGIEQDGGTLQGGETSAFGIPLVPADQRADASHTRVERAEAQIAGREIELLVVRRVVGDVHLAVHTDQDRKSTRLNSSH